MRRAEAGETKIVPDTDRGDGSEDQSDRNLAVLEQVTKELLPLAKDRGQVGQVAERIVAVFESYQGPLPHPRHFREFESASPGSAKIILEMAQAEQRHRHEMQRRETAYPYCGLAGGLLLAAGCFVGAAILGWNDKPMVALALTGVPVLGVVGWFVNARLHARASSPDDAPRKQAEPSRAGGGKRR